MKKGDRIKATVEALDEELRGVVHHQSHRIGIRGVAPGDCVEAKVVGISQHRPEAWASVRKVESRGKNFVLPPCRHAAPIRGRCGGCAAMHLTADAQQQWRLDAVKQALADLEPKSVHWVAAPRVFGYRNRSNFVVIRDDRGVVLGSYATHSREVASMDGCLIVRSEIEKAHRAIQKLMNDVQVPTGDHPDALRWVSIRVSNDGDAVVELIVRNDQSGWISPVASQIFELEGVIGVAISVNEREGNAIRVAPSKALLGEVSFSEKLGEVHCEIPEGAFAQLNLDVASKMYVKVAQWASSASVVWDLYCGVGGLGLNIAHISPNAKVFGVDSAPMSIASASSTARHYQFDARYEVTDLSDGIPCNWPEPDVVVVNPPRKGLDKAVIAHLKNLKAQSLIYMSCSPKSFARDALQLCQGGWRLEEVEAHDMLPQTPHVELLAHFRR